mmetsp:Transcript_24866/g.34274  ORF Transcript_24866/g.34274 Transcript_24866/m.34274 type:complete len:198 (-) Transcript_24866:56-649(-)|eukprot:CAMPEP_0196585966 /NCGR_PEP_ID=MMETSP1081-20130531/52716_1 /TAXON_ID=36882 /ORGANISM="Pyramimonas amylifera, Strain CCMP720" /LENGTH=197 /DNA_ID=CAMNT_0041907687 /DNA_START=292 /DNA_END=885 /DNA_ORIENTATION=+
MAKPTTVKEAIKAFETVKMLKATEAEKVELWGQIPPIEKMDATLSTLKACKHLSLSTNNIEKISSLSGMDNLTILSLGRNLIKKIENLDGVADTLEELWISYNLIDKLTNIEKLTKLRTLYMSNNKISAWGEIEKLQALESLEEVLFVGNPIYESCGSDQTKLKSEWRIEVLKKLPNLKKIDGVPVDVEEKDAAQDA